MKKNKTIAIIGGLHGDERVGVEVIKKLKQSLDGVRKAGIIANKKALKKGIRFIDQDLNRTFPGRSNGNYEERIAKRLLKRIKNFDYVLDLHSFSCNSPPFVILTKKTRKHLRLARATGVGRIVFMSPKLAFGKALIDHCCCGVSIEVGRHDLRSTLKKAMKYTKNVFDSLGFFKRKRRVVGKIEYFEIVNIFFKKGNEKLTKNVMNFKLVNKGQVFALKERKKIIALYDFYPILAREKAYSNILCLVAKRVKIEGR